MITTIKLTLKSVFGCQANYSKKKKKKKVENTSQDNSASIQEWFVFKKRRNIKLQQMQEIKS